MNSHSNESLLNLLRDVVAATSDTPSSTRLICRSRCGSLEYLSPLGVLIAILPYTNSQRTTKTTTPRKLKDEQTGPSTKPSGLTLVKHLRTGFGTPTQEVATTAHGKGRFRAQPTSENGYESRSRGLTMHQFPEYQDKMKQGIMATTEKPKKTGLYRINSRKST